MKTITICQLQTAEFLLRQGITTISRVLVRSALRRLKSESDHGVATRSDLVSVFQWADERGIQPEDMGRRAGWKVKHAAHLKLVPIIRAPAPAALSAVGIHEVNVWPRWLLDEVLDAYHWTPADEWEDD